ncbi:MAG: hypothetical protein J7K40_05945 [candidate division Zixibacteria bacterium]|nr:hypothetical protein [candidate division Zixibacteria bacterium]
MENSKKLEAGMAIPDDLNSPEKAAVKIQDEKILVNSEDSDINQHIDKCLSMVIHHEEVQQIVEIIKKVHKEFNLSNEKQDKQP